MLILNRLTTPPLNQFLTLSVPSSVPTTVSLPSVVPITAELSVKAEGRLCIILAAKHRRTDFLPDPTYLPILPEPLFYPS
jgi:hypothetical protein